MSGIIEMDYEPEIEYDNCFAFGPNRNFYKRFIEIAYKYNIEFNDDYIALPVTLVNIAFLNILKIIDENGNAHTNFLYFKINDKFAFIIKFKKYTSKKRYPICVVNDGIFKIDKADAIINACSYKLSKIFNLNDMHWNDDNLLRKFLQNENIYLNISGDILMEFILKFFILTLIDYAETKSLPPKNKITILSFFDFYFFTSEDNNSIVYSGISDNEIRMNFDSDNDDIVHYYAESLYRYNYIDVEKHAEKIIDKDKCFDEAKKKYEDHCEDYSIDDIDIFAHDEHLVKLSSPKKIYKDWNYNFEDDILKTPLYSGNISLCDSDGLVSNIKNLKNIFDMDESYD